MPTANRGRKKELTARFRKVSWGRLYWRARNKRYLRDFFDSGDVAVVLNGPVRTHYKSIEALIADIEFEEQAGEQPT